MWNTVQQLNDMLHLSTSSRFECPSLVKESSVDDRDIIWYMIQCVEGSQSKEADVICQKVKLRDDNDVSEL